MWAARPDYAPLDARAAAPLQWVQLRDAVVERWQLLSSAEYLSSPLSRRYIRKYLWPAMWFGVFFYDLAGGDQYGSKRNLILPLDAVQAMLGGIAACCVPAESLRSDFACTLISMVVYSTMTASCPELATVNPLVVGTMCACGIHVACTSTYAIGQSVFAIFFTVYGWFSLVASTLTALILCMFDVLCAGICLELAREKKAVNYLLQAGQGWCSVCVDDGKISSFSPMLADTLGTTELCGLELTQFVVRADTERLARLYRSVTTQEDFVPVLVTFRTRSCEFDARIIPFAMVRRDVKLSVHIQGERRTGANPDPHRGPAGAGSSSATRRRSNPSRTSAPSTTTFALSSTTVPAKVEKGVQTDAVQILGRPPRLVESVQRMLGQPANATQSAQGTPGQPANGTQLAQGTPGQPANGTQSAQGTPGQPTNATPKARNSQRIRSKRAAAPPANLMEVTQRERIRNPAFDWTSSASSEPAARWDTFPPLVPRVIEDPGEASIGVVFCVFTGKVVGCTPGFGALTGPVFYKEKIRDLVANYEPFMGWLEQATMLWQSVDPVVEIESDNEDERLRFMIRLARKNFRYHSGFEFHATATVTDVGEPATLSDMSVELGEGIRDREYRMLCHLKFTDVQAKYLGGGSLLRDHPAGSDAGAGAPPGDDTDFRLVPHLPDLLDEGSVDVRRVLLNIERAEIIGCTREFSFMAGPLPIAAPLRDLVVNCAELIQWLHDHTGAALANTGHECPPLPLRITAPFLKRRRRFEYHAVAHLLHMYEDDHQQAVCGVVALREVVIRWQQQR